ncbi:hypothetical protein Axi01nite_30460 [Actinoplanes xinjiangensis]|nr:hypothetical protein Axi01nite_30460 [Actinoplanes xinjiangensis]
MHRGVPEFDERLVHRAGQVGGEQIADGPRIHGALEGDRLVVGEPDPVDREHVALAQAQPGGLDGGGWAQLGDDHFGPWSFALFADLLAEPDQVVGAAGPAGHGDERAAARRPVDETVVDQLCHRGPGGHPADAVFAGQLRFGGQRVVWPGLRDLCAQRLLDAEVARREIGIPGHDAHLTDTVRLSRQPPV